MHKKVDKEHIAKVIYHIHSCKIPLKTFWNYLVEENIKRKFFSTLIEQPLLLQWQKGPTDTAQFVITESSYQPISSYSTYAILSETAGISPSM